jgi:nucleotide-binding universal stress UspA family protein
VISKILVPVRGDGKGNDVFAHAASLATRYKAHIAVAHCRPRAEDLMPYGIAISAPLRKLLLSQSSEVANQEEDGMRKELDALAVSLGITLSDKALPDTATAAWIEEQGRQVDVIKRHGRLADLICVAKPDVDRNLGSNTLKAALFNTGRPVMMCPPKRPPEALCNRIAIGWNGSIQASRAVAMTSGILAQASAVTILSSGKEVDGADSESLLADLHARGVNAEIRRFKATRKIGRDLLDNCASVGADTLIMGAYSNSHETETVFGGATQFIVDKSDMPIIFVH